MDKENWPTIEEQDQYELAITLINEMVGIRSSWIGKESNKHDKNDLNITIWRAEQVAFDKERESLEPKNAAQIKSVIDRYSPVLKAAYKNN